MIKSIVNTVGTKFFSAVFNFLILLVTSNFLGTEGRGQISLMISTITLILLLAGFVGGNALIYLCPRKPLPALLFVSYLWSLVLAIPTYFILSATQLFSREISIHITLLYLLYSFTSIHISLLFGKEKIEQANRTSLIQVISHFFLMSACFVFWGANTIQVFIYSLYITYGFAFLLSGYYLKDFLKVSFRLELSSTLKLAFAIGFLSQLANIFQFLNYRLDVYLLEKFDSLSNLGLYSTSVSIAEAALLFGSSFALVQFSKISNTEDEVASRTLTVKLTRFSILLSLFAYLPLFVFPDDFYNFLLGKDFHEVKSILIALAPGILFLGSSVTLSHYFAGTGNYKINVMASFLGLCLTLGLGVAFIPKYGFIAAAWVSSISYFCSTLVLLISFLRNSKFKLADLLPGKEELLFLKKSIIHVRNKRDSQ